MVDAIKEGILSNELDPLIMEKIYDLKEDIVLSDDNITYQITSTYNQNNNQYQNLSIIELGQCEDVLRSHYNLTHNETILLFKIEKKVDGFLIPIIEYEVYNIDIKQKLDLNLCNQTTIKIFHPVSIDENNLFKYNSSDDYYNDFCFPFTTGNDTDITLDDRQSEFIDNNLSLCESNCEYGGYSSETKKAECECKIKKEMATITKIDINEMTLLNSFKDISQKLNLKVMKCYKILFSFDGFIKNYGSYIMLIIIVIEIYILIYFICRGYNSLYIKILYFANSNHYSNVKEDNNNYNYKKIMDLKSSSNNNNQVLIFKNNILNTSKGYNKFLNSNPNKKQTKKRKKTKKHRTAIINHIPFTQSVRKDNKSRDTIISSKEQFRKNANNKINKRKMAKRKSIKQPKNTNKNLNEIDYYDYNYYLNDYEINNLGYQEALKYDKRNYCNYYSSLLRTKQLILFTFFHVTDYNSKIIKILLFFFSFALFFTINTLFFNDSTMHKIYTDSGKYNLLFQIPQIFYSSFISALIGITINKGEKLRKLLRCVKIKFVFLFVLEFLFLILFWYYIACFCAVYRNTQSHLIKDTSISFCTSLLYPFGLCLLPGIFRIPSLRNRNHNGECLYKFSKILQLF